MSNHTSEKLFEGIMIQAASRYRCRRSISTLWLLALIFVAAPHSVGAAPITIVETFDPFTQSGEYHVTNDSLTDALFAFAVENDTSVFAQAQRSTWEADVVDRDTWEQTGGLFSELGAEWGAPDTSLLNWTDYFSDDSSQLNFYYVLGDDDDPIDIGQSDGGFTFEADEPDSGFIAFTDGAILDSGQTVPEPSSAFLFLSALGSLAITGRSALRRRRLRRQCT